jgi:hypothetical protein
MKDARVQYLRDAIEFICGGLYVTYDDAQRIMRYIDERSAPTRIEDMTNGNSAEKRCSDCSEDGRCQMNCGPALRETAGYWAQRCHDKDQAEIRNPCICATTSNGARPTVSLQVKKGTDPRKSHDNSLYVYGSEEAISHVRAALSVCADGGKGEAVCDTCHGSGHVCVGTSGSDSDGNAPEFEPCPECAYGGKGEAVYLVSSEGRFWQIVSHSVWVNWQADYRNVLYPAPQAERTPRADGWQSSFSGKHLIRPTPDLPHADAEKDAALTDAQILELLSQVADENMLENHADEVIAAGRAILAATKGK